MSELDPRSSRRRGRVLLRRVVGTLAIASALWSITLQLRSDAPDRGFRPPALADGSGSASNAPIDDGLDLEVIDAVAHGTVYLYELRGAPNHRILALDPVTGATRVVREFADGEQVNGLALDRAGGRLLVPWAHDASAGGVGLATIDLASGDLREVVPPLADRWFLDPWWDEEAGRLLATRVTLDDANQPRWSVVEVDLAAGAVVELVPGAQQPVTDPRGLWFLRPDADGNGRTIERLTPDGMVVTVATAQEPMTLDHLMVVPGQASLRVAAHQQQEGRFTFGAPAGAHEGPSRWWELDPAGTASRAALPEATVRDAMTTGDGTLVWVTRRALWFATADGPREVARTRAVLFLAG